MERTEIGWWVDAQRGERATLFNGTERIGRSGNIELLRRVAREINDGIRYRAALERIEAITATVEFASDGTGVIAELNEIAADALRSDVGAQAGG